MMEATQTYVEHPTFETVWAALQETDRMMKENDRKYSEWKENFEREQAERQEKFEREMKKSAKRLDKQLGGLGNRFGDMIEYMIKPNLVPKFRKLGFEFEKAYQDTSVKDTKNNIFYQVDFTLENGDNVMIVEVKSKPNVDDVTEHIERMEKIRRRVDIQGGDKRKYFGAIAGMVFDDNTKEFALKKGFYVLEPSKKTFTITVPEPPFVPKEW